MNENTNPDVQVSEDWANRVKKGPMGQEPGR